MQPAPAVHESLVTIVTHGVWLTFVPREKGYMLHDLIGYHIQPGLSTGIEI